MWGVKACQTLVMITQSVQNIGDESLEAFCMNKLLYFSLKTILSALAIWIDTTQLNYSEFGETHRMKVSNMSVKTIFNDRNVLRNRVENVVE